MDTEQEDYDAALELSSELELIDGAEFLRAQIGVSLTEALHLCRRVAALFPGSVMAASVEAYQRQSQFP